MVSVQNRHLSGNISSIGNHRIGKKDSVLSTCDDLQTFSGNPWKKVSQIGDSSLKAFLCSLIASSQNTHLWLGTNTPFDSSFAENLL